MPVNQVSHQPNVLASSAPPPPEEAARGQPATMSPSVPLQSLRKATGAVASSMAGALRQTSALTTAALLAVVSEVLPSAAEAARGRPGVPPAQGNPYRSAPPPPQQPARPGAPPRKVMELPSPGAANPGGLTSDPMLLASAAVGTAVGLSAMAGLGVAAYKKWAADRTPKV